MADRQLAPPILGAYKVFILDMRARSYSPATIEHYQFRLTKFIDWLAGQGITELTVLNTAHARAYLAERQAGISKTTVHTEARALRAFLNFCVAEGWLAQSPMCRMPQRPRLIKAALSATDVRRVLKRSNVREQAIILFLLDTGLRASELCSLNRADVDLNTARVAVKQGKGGKDRTVYMGARVTKALLRYWADVGEPLPAEAVFKSERGRRLTRNALWKICGRLADAVGVPELSPHALRRTFAIYSLRAGMDLYTLARLMGHEGIDVLKQYLDLLPDDLEAAHAKYGPADNL